MEHLKGMVVLLTGGSRGIGPIGRKEGHILNNNY